MKYENFDQVEELVKQIKDHEEKLKTLKKYPRILINPNNFGSLNIYPGHDDPEDVRFNVIGKRFINELIKDLEDRIDKLKKGLEPL